MKVKKLLVAAMFATISAASVYAQSIQTATLQTDDGVQVFYGTDALNSAYNAAQDGNTIYLSAGLFNGGTLSKSIKIIGAGGFNADASKNTVINGAMSINRIAESYTDYLELEGFVVRNGFYVGNSSSGDNKMLRIKKINFESDLAFYARSGNFLNIEIFQCVIRNLQWQPSGDPQRIYRDVLVSNSIIVANNGYAHNTSSAIIINSIIYAPSNVYDRSLQNNIIVANKINQTPNSVSNNIFTGADNFPSVSNQSTNWENVVLSDLFVNQPENKWDASYDYNLKNPKDYIGTDGTQVGIYGGLFPWNPVPSNPQIIESKVSPVTTNDGKLNFRIKAEAQQ